MIAGGHFSNGFTVFQHGIAMARNGLVGQFNAHQFFADAFCLLSGECFLADKLFLVEFYEDTQPGHDGRDVGRQFIAIERQSHLEAQGVAATQSAGLASAAGQQLVPTFTDILVRTIYFESVLTCIASAGN